MSNAKLKHPESISDGRLIEIFDEIWAVCNHPNTTSEIKDKRYELLGKAWIEALGSYTEKAIVRAQNYWMANRTDNFMPLPSEFLEIIADTYVPPPTPEFKVDPNVEPHEVWYEREVAPLIAKIGAKTVEAPRVDIKTFAEALGVTLDELSEGDPYETTTEDSETPPRAL